MFKSKGLNEFVNIRAFSEDVSNMKELDFFVMDDGLAERETYMLADLVGVDVNGKEDVKLYFKVRYVVDQDNGEVYSDVIYNKEFTVDEIECLFSNYIKLDNINDILRCIGKSFVLYIIYRLSDDNDCGECITEIQTNKLMMI